MSYLEARSNHRVELIIFDCDGVLIDSEMIAATALSEALAEDGVHLQPMELARRYVGISDKDTLAALRAEHAEVSPRCEDRYRELVQAKLDAELVAIEGIRDVLKAIESAGIQCCVASSSSLDRLHRTLGKVGLLPCFGEKIFSSSQVPRGKPAPDLFLFAAARCEVAPDRCLVIEDSPAGITAAVAASMTVAGFCGAAHCGPDHAARLQGLGASHTFGRWDADDFLNWLNRFDKAPISA